MWSGAFIGRFSIAACNFTERGALISTPCCIRCARGWPSEPYVEADQPECHDEPGQVNHCEREEDLACTHPATAAGRPPRLRRIRDRRERARQSQRAQRIK